MSLSIGQLAKQADIGIETIRFYERRGLVPDPPRAPSGYRRYPESFTKRLRFIQRAKKLGFTLDEVDQLLRLQDYCGQDASGKRAEVKSIAQQKLVEIEERITGLQRMRALLADLEQQCSGRGKVKGCPIIDALSGDYDATS